MASTAALTELHPDQCASLLAGARLGRLAVNLPGWPPLIRPISFRYERDSQSILFRCALGSKLHALSRAQRAAFEIDGEDAEGPWSVIVIGPVEEVTGAAELARLAGSDLAPWLADGDARWLRIRAGAVSGRRVAAAHPR